MINYIRTLLLNTSGSASPGPGYPGEEYVPPDYVSIQLPTDLAAVWSALFGPNPDRAMLNYRLRELMAIIHSTELAPYATVLDPRITYWPLHNDDSFRALTFGAAAQQLSGTATPLFISSPNAFTSLGQLYWQWNVSVLNGTTADIQTLTSPQANNVFNYAMSGGLSNALPLSNTGLTVQFGTPGIQLPEWLITGLAEPQYQLTAVLPALENANVDSIFISGAPFTGLSALWEIQTLPAIYRIGAAALALAYRINNLVTPPG